MDTLTSLSRLLHDQPEQPPIDQWNPVLSGDIDIVIKANGDWIHEGGKITRGALVNLFFSILRRESDGEYYLVTPVEKWRVQVEQAVCVVVDMEVLKSVEGQQQIVFSTSVGRKVLLGRHNPLVVERDVNLGEPLPLLGLDYGLTAKLLRAVFYRLVEAGEECAGQLRVFSDGQWFVLGDL